MVGYEMCVKVPVKVLVTIDPADFLPVPGITGNVEKAVNFYQQRGGRAVIHSIDQNGKDLGVLDNVGNLFSSVVKGVAVSGAENHRIDTESGYRDGVFNFPKLSRLYAKDVNHDTMPWYVQDRVEKLLAK